MEATNWQGVCGVATVDEQAEYISIAEASKLLAVHRNTIRNRIKRGRYKRIEAERRLGARLAIWALRR